MRAAASVTVERIGGRSRCTGLRSDPPLTLRDTPSGVHLVASGAGPVGGDELALSVRVGDGATLQLRSVAASMAHPGPRDEPSHLAVDVELGAGASLRVEPQPTILVRGCDHRVTTRIRLGADAQLVWRDELVLGRHDEPSGSVLQRLVVDGPGGPVLRNDLALGPRWPGSQGPAGVGGARAVGTVLVVGADLVDRLGPLAAVAGVRWAVTPLGGRATGAQDRPDVRAALVTAVAAGASALRDAFDGLVVDAGHLVG